MSAVRNPAPEQEAPPERISPEEYLRRERLAPFRSEYVRGYVYPMDGPPGSIEAMAGAKPVHNIITLNIGGEVRARLKGKPCTSYSNDQKVQSRTQDTYFYPDVLVVCGQPVYQEGTDDVIANPTLVVEVLSPSTARYDKKAKFADYARIPSLTDYLLVSVETCHVQHYARQDNGQWLVTLYSEMNASMPLPALGIELPLSEIYDRVEFDPAG